MAEFRHLSVLAEETLRYLAPRPGGVYVDGTLGGGGHARLILEASGPDGVLIGIDRDRDALAAAAKVLEEFGGRARLMHGNFADIADIVTTCGIGAIDGFIADLGVSSYQLDTAERGFSFQKDAPLDMRMNRTEGATAADLVNGLAEAELAGIIREYGEERWAVRIAAFIAKARAEAPIETTMHLVDIIKGAIPKAKWEERLHPATRTFQALRIAVNEELESVERGIAGAVGLLKPGGRVAVISFHSLEDRIVKQSFRRLAGGCTCPKGLMVCICGNRPQVKILTGKPVMAGDIETERNPRARSARMRVAEKL